MINEKFLSINKWIFFSATFFCGPLFAEPSGLLMKMMQTEISMFSYGMDKLNAEVKSSINKNGWFGSARYDWDANQIQINYRSFNGKLCSNEKTCFDLIKMIDEENLKYWCISKNDDGMCDLIDTASDAFSPNGFSIRNFYDGKSSDVAITDVKNYVAIKGQIYKDKKTYTCIRKYTSQKMMCGVE